MTDLLARPELALAAALAVALAWVVLAFWARVRAVGDDVGRRLDALQPRYDMADLRVIGVVPAARDYSGARGPCPLPPTRHPSLYDALVAQLGFDPLGGAS